MFYEKRDFWPTQTFIFSKILQFLTTSRSRVICNVVFKSFSTHKGESKARRVCAVCVVFRCGNSILFGHRCKITDKQMAVVYT